MVDPLLLELAGLYGILPEYHDVLGELRQASPEALVSILGALGVDAGSPARYQELIDERRLALHRRQLEPVLIGRPGEPVMAAVRLPIGLPGTLECRIRLEHGEVLEWSAGLDQLPVEWVDEYAGLRIEIRTIQIYGSLPPGYHDVTITAGGSESTARLIVAPLSGYTGADNRRWGLFLPLYAAHHDESLGIGTYSDLGWLSSWAGSYGASLFGTLPLLATFLNEPFDPSPYAPVSRRFWSELFVNISAVQELQTSPAAQAMLASTEVQQELTQLRKGPLVNYRRVASLKREVLSMLARTLLERPSARQDAWRAWVDANPLVTEYARFMAAVDARQESWPNWPVEWQRGNLPDEAMRQEDVDYHRYAQWIASEQLARIAGTLRAAELYLDLPLGVHRDGFDVWHQQHLFAVPVRVGAPPDPLSWDGQDWGFPPLHPERIREDGYEYFRQCIRHHLQHAGALRIDHVMGYHRLFWIPEQMSAADGVYVTYRHEELYAVLTLESHRNSAALIGEDLGTVPPGVREAMHDHGLARMYVVPFEVGEPHEPALRPPLPGILATLNTHDMPPFATAWQEMGAETQSRILGFLRDNGYADEGDGDVASVFRAIVRFLANSQAGVVLLNLEDFWGETEPQNVPGTGVDQPNWRRKTRLDVDQIVSNPDIADLLEELNSIRNHGR